MLQWLQKTFLDSLRNLYERPLECHIVRRACKLYPYPPLNNIKMLYDVVFQAFSIMASQL